METLVLSASYEPMQVVSWQRAITLFFMDKVEVVEEYADKHIRTVSVTLPMPSVVRFLKAMKNRKRAVKFSRQNVYARDKGRCQFCGVSVPRHLATYDHVMPRSRGGRTTWENVVIACVTCNQRKADRTPEEARMRLLSTPVKPKLVPGSTGFTMTYVKGMPTSWGQFVRDTTYWYGEIDSD